MYQTVSESGGEHSEDVKRFNVLIFIVFLVLQFIEQVSSPIMDEIKNIFLKLRGFSTIE